MQEVHSEELNDKWDTINTLKAHMEEMSAREAELLDRISVLEKCRGPNRLEFSQSSNQACQTDKPYDQDKLIKINTALEVAQ